MRLLRLVVVIAYLHDLTRRQGNGQVLVIERQKLLRHLLKYLQLVLVNIDALVLAESVKKKPAACEFRGYDSSRPTSTSP